MIFRKSRLKKIDTNSVKQEENTSLWENEPLIEEKYVKVGRKAYNRMEIRKIGTQK